MATRRDAPRTKAEGTAPSESSSAGFSQPGMTKERPGAPPKRAAPTQAESRTPSRVEVTQQKATTTRAEVSNEARYRMISEAAYLRAERRGFEPGREVEDWLAAEQEVERLLRAEHVRTAQ
jgi:hypothetical protein